MLFLHETHQVVGAKEEEFEAAFRDQWMPMLARGDDARLLWFCHHAHGTGVSYNVVTITAVRDGAAWERLALRIQKGDLQPWMGELDTLRHDVTGKLLLPVYWSALQEVDFSRIPTEPLDHAPSLYMHDTGWPDAPLDEYIRFWDESYARPMRARPRETWLLDVQACFQIAHGTHRRREAILMQKIVNNGILVHLIADEVAQEHRQPGSYMVEALKLRDQWESKLLRTSRWSPLF